MAITGEIHKDPAGHRGRYALHTESHSCSKRPTQFYFIGQLLSNFCLAVCLLYCFCCCCCFFFFFGGGTYFLSRQLLAQHHSNSLKWFSSTAASPLRKASSATVTSLRYISEIAEVLRLYIDLAEKTQTDCPEHH